MLRGLERRGSFSGICILVSLSGQSFERCMLAVQFGHHQKNFLYEGVYIHKIVITSTVVPNQYDMNAPCLASTCLKLWGNSMM